MFYGTMESISIHVTSAAHASLHPKNAETKRKMNPILDAFLAAFFSGATFTVWLLVAFLAIVYWFNYVNDGNDDDDDEGTYQPVRIRKDDE